MVVIAAFAIIIAFTAGFYTLRDQPKGEINLAVGAGRQVRVRETVKPFAETEDARYVKQSYDYSCGSAALATLLRFYLGEKYTEKQVIQGLLRYGDSDQIAKRRAFSLLDMKKFVSVLGYQGVGYKAELEDLKTLEGPAIVPIKIFDYRHFAVLKGVHDGHIFFADPWRGNISFTLAEFKDAWYENVIFVVSPKGGKALRALQLKEEDLRYIDEDTARRAMADRIPAPNLKEQRTISDKPGTYQIYRQ